MPRNRPRIGAVSYLNSKPLVEGLSARLPGGLALDYPSRLAASLAADKLDVALIPSIEVLRSEGDYRIVSDACVAARGPVRSVKVYFRVPPGDVRTLALDEGSRTSATLTSVLLHHRYGITPAVEPLPLGRVVGDSSADAILLIGDRAMFPVPGRFVAEWDLGDEWNRWTGLPFVFAVWAARNDRLPAGLASLLSSIRDAGVADVERIARREARLLGLDAEVVLDYLTNNLHFTLSSAEQSGLKLFARLAHEAGLAPGGIDRVFCAGNDDVSCDEPDASHGLPSDPSSERRYVAAR
ncbi:MAG: menaquinone biosynthesis protein [Planctomycetaceae bacterium]